ncbi:hypothetical protein Ct61P_11815 [Colletotrichum tofieldiae]|nr:hypothetical protein Ct61P_11815 [Colletotrichum tofieldiae]
MANKYATANSSIPPAGHPQPTRSTPTPQTYPVRLLHVIPELHGRHPDAAGVLLERDSLSGFGPYNSRRDLFRHIFDTAEVKAPADIQTRDPRRGAHEPGVPREHAQSIFIGRLVTAADLTIGVKVELKARSSAYGWAEARNSP